MKKRILTAIYCVVCAITLFTVHASAYVDPSVVSYGVQALIGIVAAGGAVFLIWWRKVKKKVSKKLGIDENAGKTVEEDVVVTDDFSAQRRRSHLTCTIPTRRYKFMQKGQSGFSGLPFLCSVCGLSKSTKIPL